MRNLLSLLFVLSTFSFVLAQKGFIGNDATNQTKVEETFLKQKESER